MGHFHVLISWMLPWGMYPILLFSFLPKIVFLIFSSQVRRLSLRATCGTFGSRKYFGPCYFCPVRWLGEHPRTAHALVVAGFINRCRPCTRESFRQNALLGSTLNVLAESTLVVCFTEKFFWTVPGAPMAKRKVFNVLLLAITSQLVKQFEK